MKKTLPVLSMLSLLLALVAGCRPQVISTVPRMPVLYEIDLHSAEATPLLSPGGYLIITKPNKYFSSIGFGGLLVIHSAIDNGYSPSYYAYDLACPNESRANVKLFVNDKLNAECPLCHSIYSILYGGGNPIGGHAQSPLLNYSILATDGKLTIRN